MIFSEGYGPISHALRHKTTQVFMENAFEPPQANADAQNSQPLVYCKPIE